MSKAEWRPMTREELAAVGKRSVGTHVMTKRVMHWPYCARCGLVALKNDPSRRALKAPCVVVE